MANTFYGLTLEEAIEEDERTLSQLKDRQINESVAFDTLSRLASAYDSFGRPDLAGKVHENKADYLKNKANGSIEQYNHEYTLALLKYAEAKAGEARSRVLKKLIR
jgi:hypothetical protein